MPCGGIGAPTVSLEQLTGRRVVALMSAEIGGGNGLQPISRAARIGLPVLDADGMGRVFPEVPQVSMEVAGISPSPCVMTGERGNVIVFRAVPGPRLERMARAAADPVHRRPPPRSLRALGASRALRGHAGGRAGGRALHPNPGARFDAVQPGQGPSPCR